MHSSNTPWTAIVLGLLIGLGGLWMSMRVWRGKPITRWAGKRGFPNEMTWAYVGLLPASGLFLFGVLAGAASTGIHGTSGATSVLCWTITLVALAACLLCLTILFALLIRPSLTTSILRPIVPPHLRSE
jgi:hypothetical protein